MTRQRSEAAIRAIGRRSARLASTEAPGPLVSPFDEILGESQVMKTCRESARAVLDGMTDLRPPPVLIVGESGTGKRLVAKALHRAGPRSSGPIVDLEIGGFSWDWFEPLLFGFERNAFPGAQRRQQGLLQQAHGGTLCLKDIDRLPLRLARMVLAVLGDGTLRRMKGSEVEPADIWLIGTSHTRASVFRPFRPTVPPRSRLATVEHVGAEKRDGARQHPDRAAAARAGGSGIVPGASLTIARDGIERALRGRAIPSSNSPLPRGAHRCPSTW
jgi:sigma-54 interacting transcriptional regulator